MRMEMRNENVCEKWKMRNENVKFCLKLDGESYELTEKDFFNELSN